MSEPIITTGMECENLCNISIYLYKFQSSAYLKNTEKEMKKKTINISVHRNIIKEIYS